MRSHTPTVAILAALLGACAQDAPLPSASPDPATDPQAAALLGDRTRAEPRH